MPSITLYSIDGSPPCRSVLMVLDILGLEVDKKFINTLAGDQHKPEFLEKNHLHTVPLLEEKDFCLADSHAIITYLVSKYGAEHRSTLYPVDLRVRSTVDQRLYFDAGTLFPRFGAIMDHLFKNKAKEITPEIKEKIEEAYGFIEKYLEASPFLAADHVTLADIGVIATVSTIDILIPVDAKYVKIHEWWNRLKQFDWYKNGNEKGLSDITGYVKRFLES